MKINVFVKPGEQIRPFYVFFIISSIQIGVGIVSAPQQIFSSAKQDSWISIFMIYGYMILLIYIFFLILKQYKNADIFGIQVDVFGTWIGKALGIVYIIYFFVALLILLLTYIEIVQVFLYPTMPAFTIGLFIMILSVYCILGGLRVIVGACFLFLIFSQWLLLLLYDPISRMDFDHLLPIFQSPLPDLLKGAYAASFSLFGFEILLLIYPFLSTKKHATRSAIFGISYTILVLLLCTIITIGYYGLNDIKNISWPVLTLFKTVSYSFVERLDYIVIVEWMMVILPNIFLLMWGVMHGMERLFKVPQKRTLYSSAILLLILVSIIKYNETISKIKYITATGGFLLIFVYPLLLLPLVLIKKKWRTRKGSAVK